MSHSSETPEIPETTDPDDLRIVTHLWSAGNGKHPWPRDRRVSYEGLLHAAATVGWSPAAVVARLPALGYTDVELPESPPATTADPDDHLLTKNTSFLKLGSPVPLMAVLDAAVRTGRSPADAARRLTVLGYRMPGAAGHPPLPETPCPQDFPLVRKSRRYPGDWLDWGDEAHPQHVLTVARELKCNPHAAAKRLIELGIRLPYTPEPWDEQIFDVLDGGGNYVTHVLAVAHRTGRTRADIVARLETLGRGRRDEVLDVVPEADDLRLLSANLDGEAPYIDRLRMLHVLRAALALGRSPAEIADRLATLGHRLDDKARLPAVVDEQDVLLVETVTDVNWGFDYWAGEFPLKLEHVLRTASLTGRSPADVASRLTTLGYEIPDDIDYPKVRGTQRR